MYQDQLREKISNFGRAAYTYAMFLIINIVVSFITVFMEIEGIINTIINYGIFGLEFILLILITLRAKSIADDLNDFVMRQFYIKLGVSLIFTLISVILYPILNNLIWDYYTDWLTNDSLNLTDFGIIYSPEMITDVILAFGYVLKYLAFVNLNSFIFRNAETLSPQLAHLCSKEVGKLKKANIIFLIELPIAFFDIITTFFGFGNILLTIVDLILLLVGLIFEISGFYKLGNLLKGPGINRYPPPNSYNATRIYSQEPTFKSNLTSGTIKAKYCPKCGKILPEDGTFCMSCGSEIPKID